MHPEIPSTLICNDSSFSKVWGMAMFDKCIWSDVTVTIVTILFLLNNYVMSNHLDYAPTFYLLSLVSPSHTSFHKLTWILFIWAHSEFRMVEIWKGFRILESDKSCHFSWEVQIRCKVLGKDAVREWLMEPASYSCTDFLQFKSCI